MAAQFMRWDPTRGIPSTPGRTLPSPSMVTAVRYKSLHNEIVLALRDLEPGTDGCHCLPRSESGMRVGPLQLSALGLSHQGPDPRERASGIDATHLLPSCPP